MMPPKAIALIRPDFTCTEIVKYYYLVPHMRGHPDYNAFFFLYCRRGGFIRTGLLYHGCKTHTHKHIQSNLYNKSLSIKGSPIFLIDE